MSIRSAESAPASSSPALAAAAAASSPANPPPDDAAALMHARPSASPMDASLDVGASTSQPSTSDMSTNGTASAGELAPRGSDMATLSTALSTTALSASAALSLSGVSADSAAAPAPAPAPAPVPAAADPASSNASFSPRTSFSSMASSEGSSTWLASATSSDSDDVAAPDASVDTSLVVDLHGELAALGRGARDPGGRGPRGGEVEWDLPTSAPVADREMRALLRRLNQLPAQGHMHDPEARALLEAQMNHVVTELKLHRSTPVPAASSSSAAEQSQGSTGSPLLYARKDPGWNQCIVPALREIMDHFLMAGVSGAPSARMRTYRPPMADSDAHFVDDRADLTLVVVGDLGANGSPFQALTLGSIRSALAQTESAVLIHLGDVYYNGTEAECTRFMDAVRTVFPNPATRTFWSIPGNHEANNSLKGFFKCMLAPPASGTKAAASGLGGGRQRHSFFCHEYPRLRLLVLGLDTAFNSWPDSHGDDLDSHVRLHPAEERWVQSKMQFAEAHGYRVIACTHHPVFSAFARPPQFHTVLAAQILKHSHQPILAWFFGHEHRLLVYQTEVIPADVMPPAAAARIGHMECLGHGAVPAVAGQYDHPVLPDTYDKTYAPSLFAHDGEMVYGHGYAVLRACPDGTIRITHIESETGKVVGRVRTLATL